MNDEKWTYLNQVILVEELHCNSHSNVTLSPSRATCIKILLFNCFE